MITIDWETYRRISDNMGPVEKRLIEELADDWRKGNDGWEDDELGTTALMDFYAAFRAGWIACRSFQKGTPHA